MSVRRILEAFEQWRAAGQPLVLATVYETLGSTYSKAGHRILIAANGDYQGLVSGGCLEGDLAERAGRVAADGRAAAVSYDLRDEADDLWGLGVGCNGLLRVFLQPLRAEQGYEPFASIASLLLERDVSVVATVIEPDVAAEPGGGTLIWSCDGQRAFRLGDDAAQRLAHRARDVAETGRAVLENAAGAGLVLYAPLKPVPRLLVLGAGLDAVPLVAMAATLGWRIWVADHRPAYIERGGFAAAEQARVIDPRSLASEYDLTLFDAVVVMSHHLTTDQTYLRELAAVDVPYLGVLGPPQRKARLLDALGDELGESLLGKLRGPVGIDIGADSPESIALSILAEMQATFAGYPRTS
jgi:xanthine/CO dehydrogenase XdhC/CoxF family maturation factor